VLIAVLSDIHANAAALDAALGAARAAGAEELFLLGDYVGYYYEPRRVLETLSRWPREAIRGNHEELLGRAEKDAAFASELRARYGSGHDAALRELAGAQIAELGALPENLSVERDGLRIELCHGSPWKGDEYVYPDAEDSVLARCAGSNADFVLMGHTHRAFIKRVGATTVANAGSVGQARDAGGQAAWALLDTRARALTLCRTPYDAAPLAAEAARRDPKNAYLRDILSRKPS
jgi:putative phosphoesterase